MSLIFLTSFTKALRPSESFDISTPSSISVGPFARQAKISHLVNRLLTHIKDSTYGESFNFEERKLLARTLEAFSTLLPEEAPQPWPMYCGAIGMCYRSGVLHFVKHQLCMDEQG